MLAEQNVMFMDPISHYYSN